MLEIGPQHSIEYRQDILKPFFKYIQSAESFYVLGGASMGKTRLLDFLMKGDVKKHYLGEKANQIWLIRVDLNRLSIKNEAWAFYELLLSSIVLELGNHEIVNNIRTELVDLDRQVIQSRDLLLALRFFEMAVNRLCQEFDLNLCFLFDEFDEAYSDFSGQTFSQLRAVRDANKNYVSFGLFLRNPPERLRTSQDNESFYELLSRNCIGLTPYTLSDTISMLQQLEVRRNYPLTPGLRKKIFDASGGHSGLISAIMSILIETPNSYQQIESPNWLEWLSQQTNVVEECRKIWNGLSEDEKAGLSSFKLGKISNISLQVERLLFTKGILRDEDDRAQFFSYLFEQYVSAMS
jgi:hypothetical protein